MSPRANWAFVDDTRHALQPVTTGKASLADMTEAELEVVVAAPRAHGFKPPHGFAHKGRKAAARGDTRFAHVLWGKLALAAAVDRKGAAGLNACIRARFERAWGAAPRDVDQMQDPGQIATGVEALKAMCRRAGMDR